MEAENNIDELLVRYLLNETGEDENLFVGDWIHLNEANRLHFEGLKKTIGLLAMRDGIEKINVDAEWSHLKGLIAAGSLQQPVFSEGSIVEAHFAKPVENDMVENMPARKKLYRLFIPAAVAASVIIALAAGWWPFHKETNSTTAILPDSASVAKISPANSVVQHEINSSDKIKIFALPDGSNVRLSANSEITYSEPADGHQRNVVLKGEAGFAVAKDKTKPFTVFSGDISTRAVGTRFIVTAFENEKLIQVRLNEGKVLIKSEKTINNKLTEDLYLLPGQKLIYDKNLQTAKIRSFGRSEKSMAGNNDKDGKAIADNPLLTEYNKKSWFMFNNQSLIEIFHSLEMMYDVKIVYAKKDVEQRYFIGTFSKSDAVESILQQIAALNKLTVTKKDSSFIIKKRK